MAQFDLTITLEYDLVSATNQVVFVEKVNERITEGWRPLGGAFVYQDEVYQTMVREKLGERRYSEEELRRLNEIKYRSTP